MDISSISKQVPDGISYQVKNPNTLDLAERLTLAINALTRAWIPEENWALAFNVDMAQNLTVLGDITTQKISFTSGTMTDLSGNNLDISKAAVFNFLLHSLLL